MTADVSTLGVRRKQTETGVLRTARTAVMGTEIFHEEVGSGPPLVLLHGLNDSHRTWRRILPYLAPSRRVLMPDLPGCGFMWNLVGAASRRLLRPTLEPSAA